jgi:hypothetical protein
VSGDDRPVGDWGLYAMRRGWAPFTNSDLDMAEAAYEHDDE